MKYLEKCKLVIQKDSNLKYMDTGKDVAFTRRIWISAQHHKRGRKSCSESCQCQLVSGELVCDQNETLELKYYSDEEKPQLFTGSHEALWNEIYNQ